MVDWPQTMVRIIRESNNGSLRSIGTKGQVPSNRLAALGNIDRQDRQDRRNEKLLHSLQSLNRKPIIIKDLKWTSPSQFQTLGEDCFWHLIRTLQ